MIILLEGAAATGYIIGICLWYILVAMFWITVFVVWGIFALFGAIFNLVRRRAPSEERWRPRPHVPRPRRPARSSERSQSEALAASSAGSTIADARSCRSCGSSLDDSPAFCDLCGATNELVVRVDPASPLSTAARLFCTECGSHISDNWPFCDSCGTPQLIT